MEHEGKDTITKEKITHIPLEYLADFNFLTPGQAIAVYLVDEMELDYAEAGKKIGRKSQNMEHQHKAALVKISEKCAEMEKQEAEEARIFGKQE